MSTKLHRDSVAAVKAWCSKEGLKLTKPPRHVHPRTYVIGQAAPLCLIVAPCWADSEKHMQQWDKENTLATVRTFDPSLKAGDWCITAYVCRDGCQETVAIPIGSKT